MINLAYHGIFGSAIVDKGDPDGWVIRSAGPKRVFGHQGVIARADGYTLLDNNRITRYDLDWVQQAENTDPQGDINTVGNLIDCFEYNGYIRLVRTRNDTTDYIEAFHADTLVYDAAEGVAFTAGPNFAGFSTCCAGPVEGYLYGVDEGAAYIQVHDMSDGSHVEDIAVVGETMTQVNGIHFRDGYFYFAERSDEIWRCAADGTGLELVLTIGDYGGCDGMSGRGDSLFILMDASWEGLFEMVPWWAGVTQAAGTTGNFIVNGDFETQDLEGWQAWPDSTGYNIIFGGGIGATPDSWIAQSAGGAAFMLQSIVVPQEAWDSVDAGLATVDLDYSQFGSGNGSMAITCFDEHFTQLGQYGYSLTGVGWSAWSDRGLTSQAIPAGTRMIFAQVHGNGTTTYFDNISASLTWPDPP